MFATLENRMNRAVFASACLLSISAPALVAQEAQRPLTLDDYGAWSRITQVSLSPNGQWMAYAHQPNDGDATFFVRSLDGDDTHEAMNGTEAAFSNDGRWVAFLTSPPRRGSGPTPRTTRANPAGTPPHRSRDGRGIRGVLCALVRLQRRRAIPRNSSREV